MDFEWAKHLVQGGGKLLSTIRELDPRIVRLRDPRRYPPRLTAALVLGAILVIGAVSFGATRRGSKNQILPGPPPVPPPEKPKRQAITKTLLVPPDDLETETENEEQVMRHPRFFDPVYVFTESPAEQVAAYPLANPPGVVVDLTGTPEPEGEPARFVGEDGRIRAVRRRTTARGLRYIVGLTTPVRRIEVVHDGNVVMIFPTE
ncbi:MAG: hypothetical protein GY854_25725 [Deltaproteobacteria bacterium]|nr:hypothetical protein [Deltaproteobacteria bacterium]